MFGLGFLCALTMLGADGATAAPATDGDHAAYRAEAARVGRDPDAHVRLALWCESRGLDAERARHLAMAVLTKPDHALARTLLGLVPDGGKWRRPEEVARRAHEDAALMAKLAAYDERRSAARPDADSQWKLALWCEEQGLEPEAKGHLLAVVRIDPSREAAWKRLGYKEFGGRWLTEAQVAAIRAEAAAQEKANRDWLPRLERLRADLKLADRRTDAESSLAAITDPRAVPAVAATFAEGDPVRAVQILGQIDAIPASRALATLAVWTPSDEARRHAVEVLRQRDPREYAGLLIGMIREPGYQFETGFVGGASDGKIRRAWRLETPKEEIVAVYGRPVQWIVPPRLHADWVPSNPAANPWANAWAANWDPMMMGFGSSEALTSALLGTAAAMGIPGAPAAGAATPMPNGPIVRPDSASWNRMIAQAQNAAYLRDVQIQQILAGPPTTDSLMYPRHMRNFAGYLPLIAAKMDGPAPEQYRRRSEAAAGVLGQVTGLDLGTDQEGWKSWYMSQLGYDYTPRPKVQPKRRYVIGFVSCFAAGTPVLTQTGRRPIEEIAVGDLVLAMDAATGALGFHPVYAVHHNPPSRTLKVELEGETVVASTFHRFWVAGRGWVMARDLKPGDPVRTLDGLRPVRSVAEEKVQPVFNLDVAEAHSFFVGTTGALVHDNTVPGPRVAAFDAPTARTSD
jgi:thioredoxin-like negative regulator of GroEL